MIEYLIQELHDDEKTYQSLDVRMETRGWEG